MQQGGDFNQDGLSVEDQIYLSKMPLAGNSLSPRLLSSNAGNNLLQIEGLELGGGLGGEDGVCGR
jgi:hypothetical protein